MTRRLRYQVQSAPATVEQRRELAALMRDLPGRYSDRLPASTFRQVKGSAAAGQWEQALDQLITVLGRLARGVTPAERDELRMISAALDMPVGRVEALVPSPCENVTESRRRRLSAR
ncbi:hypothetical protein [Actinoallomurus oryzae]